MAFDYTTIRDSRGVIIGRIRTDNNGNKAVFDARDHMIGRYNKASDITIDMTGNIVARGDNCGLLISLNK